MPSPAPNQTAAKVVNPRRNGIDDEPPSPHTLSARVKAEGRSGVRRIRIHAQTLLRAAIDLRTFVTHNKDFRSLHMRRG